MSIDTPSLLNRNNEPPPAGVPASSMLTIKEAAKYSSEATGACIPSRMIRNWAMNRTTKRSLAAYFIGGKIKTTKAALDEFLKEEGLVSSSGQKESSPDPPSLWFVAGDEEIAASDLLNLSRAAEAATEIANGRTIKPSAITYWAHEKRKGGALKHYVVAERTLTTKQHLRQFMASNGMID